VEYQQIAAVVFFPVPSTDALECPGPVRGGMCGLVFGTLLGPEATGPCRGGRVPFGGRAGSGVGLFVSGFLAAPGAHVCVCGVWYGVVV
jgi:hypothetical protein